MNRRLAVNAFGLFLALAVPPALADAPPPMLTPAEIKWGNAPPGFPKGAKLAVLYGDPAKAGELFIVRLKMPANYKLPAHWHPTDENITVISGTFLMGMGDKLDPAKAKPYPPGSFMVTPAKTNHYALVKGEAIVEVSAIGPFAITYVNPDDDPSKVPEPKK
jgi:quercetin dioxygenase-like cupin family protein